MQAILTVSFWFLMGGLCAHYARGRGRSSKPWFFIGLLFGIFGLIALFMLPKLKKEAASLPQPTPAGPSLAHKLWYYLDPQNNSCGPMSSQALESAKAEGKITLETFVWNEELTEWKPLGEILQTTSST